MKTWQDEAMIINGKKYTRWDEVEIITKDHAIIRGIIVRITADSVLFNGYINPIPIKNIESCKSTRN